jgi:hypothetical protein
MRAKKLLKGKSAGNFKRGLPSNDERSSTLKKKRNVSVICILKRFLENRCFWD